MNILAFCASAVLILCAVALVRQLRPELVPMTVSAAGVLMLAYLIKEAVPVLTFITGTAESAGMGGYFALLTKSLAIALTCQVCAEVCRDCGESALSSKVELAGKIGIIILSLPILKQLLGMARELLV